MTEQEIRQQVVNTIQSWLGVKKGTLEHHTIIDLYNSHTPLPRGYKVSYTDSWCATTVSAVGIVLGLTDIMPVECSCGELIRLYQAIGRWVENDAYIPNLGDLVLYAWKDDGVGDCKKAPNHVGMVTSVIGNTITVVEGNMGSPSKVGTRTIKVNGRYIRGYCCPDYASKASDDTVFTTEENEDMDVARFKELWYEMRKDLQDNDSGTWSDEARQWAKSTGLINGMGTYPDGEQNYAWEDLLTREQATVLLYRFAKMMGKA